MKFVIFFLIFFLNITIHAQCPTGNIIINSQQEFNEFSNNYSNCKIVNGNVTITGAVTNLQPLKNIEEIKGNLIIRNTDIEDFTLNLSITKIDGDLQIQANTLLKDLNSFNELIKVNNIYIDGMLGYLDGFTKLEQVNTVDLKSLGMSLDAFQNLKFVENTIDMDNSGLILGVFNAFDKVEYIKGSLIMEDYPHGVGLFSELKYVGNNLFIRRTGINEIEGFNKLVSIGSLGGGNFEISESLELTVFTGFNSLERIYGNMIIKDNPELPTISGFSNLRKIDKALIIQNNNNLPSLMGLENLISVSGNFGIIGLIVSNNSNLKDCSAICTLLANEKVYDDLEIINNPSECSTRQEIQEKCLPDFDNDGIPDDIDLDDDNDGILDVIEDNGILDRDTDQDGHPDKRDLDSDNDDCFDVIEAGFTDKDNNGTLGSLPDTVDENGLIINVKSGYEEPLDEDDNDIPDFQEQFLLNAGNDVNLNICKNGSSIDLFDYLGPNAQIGGTWSPKLSSNSSVFDPSLDNEGLYAYTVNNYCVSKTALVEVVFTPQPNPGIDSSITICQYETSFALIDYLGGNPDSNGYWEPALPNGIFDPQINNAGKYVYRVSNNNCEVLSSEINVAIFDRNETVNYELLTKYNNDGSYDISLKAENESNYIFTLDNRDNGKAEFYSVLPGVHKIEIIEIDGCSYTSNEIYLIGFPNYFTPNSDGINDTWKPIGTGEKELNILIYDRYGTLITTLTNGEDWDGTFNGQPLPEDDYWFKATIDLETEERGHFSLIR
ncbi:T9SS type B sorting domain-containing protein [Zunongwangia endophytica]|uniref:T9SS type B sorting domain-containing protein n=1 Tax=Zunongwangia endophytica TaxID=1808945 RepID=A0ABV8HFS2_9FLAO|nr:T9SS type B sorting domain-containing protein [Zunongwangia endophytica]MDN3594061.1 T9SS type B sorting domain-containing protein [Zunongwangia endophytica]